MSTAAAERLRDKVSDQMAAALDAEDYETYHRLFTRGQRLHNLISSQKPAAPVPYPAVITYVIGNERISFPAHPYTIDGLAPPSCAPAHNLNLYYAACRKATSHAQSGNSEQASIWQQRANELFKGLIEVWPIEAILHGPSSDRKDT